MKLFTFAAIIGAVLGVILIVGAASAVTVTVTPSHVDPGDTITVTYTDLPEGANCVLEVEGNLDIPSGASTFVFEVDHLTMPFSLTPGAFTVTNFNTVSNRITLTDFSEGSDTEAPGVQEFVYTGQSVNGQFTKVIPFTHLESGTWSARDEGTIVSGVSTVTATVMMEGLKEGPDDSETTFQLGDTNSGVLVVTITVNDTIVLQEEITVTGNIQPVQTGPVFNNLGFLVTPAKGSSFVASANPFSMQPGSGATVVPQGSMLSFFAPQVWSQIHWDNRWAAAFSV